MHEYVILIYFYIRIFEDKVAEALDCGDAVGVWLASFLGKDGLRLLYHSMEVTQRELTPLQKKFPHFIPTDKVCKLVYMRLVLILYKYIF